MKTKWKRRATLINRIIEEAVRRIVLNLGRLCYRMKIVGGECLPAEGGALFICNHVSYADAIPLSLACCRRFRFTSAERLFGVPLLGHCLRAFGSIPVSTVSARETIRRMVDCIAAGEVVLLFPEGQLTLDGRRQEIKGGYELVARRAECSVVMVHLDGLWGSIFSFAGGRFFFKWPCSWRREVIVTFSNPLPISEATPERLAAFWDAAERSNLALSLGGKGGCRAERGDCMAEAEISG